MENAQGDGRSKYVDSLEAAAGVLGRSVLFLQRLKGLGCPAFRGSRVYVDEIEPYVLENNLLELERECQALEQVDAEIQRERLRAMRFAQDVRERQYVRVEDYEQVAARLGAELIQLLRAKLEEEYPDLQAMKSREELKAVNQRIIDEVCHIIGGAGWVPRP